MMTRWCIGTGLGSALAALAVPLLYAQSEKLPVGAGSGATAVTTRPVASAGIAADAPSSPVLRTINDPSTGLQWVLLRDESHPGGPGRLVPASEAKATLASVKTAPAKTAPVLSAASLAEVPAASGPGWGSETGTERLAQPVSPKHEAATSPVPPLIRAGEHILIEQHSPVMDVQLVAIALGPAVAGSTFNVRLQIGGKVVRAIAEGPGHASFAPMLEGQP